MGQQKLKGANLQIVFDSEIRAFDANHPITGRIEMQLSRPISAYGIQMSLQLKNSSKVNDLTNHADLKLKKVVWERTEMIVHFASQYCDPGESSHPFVFHAPIDMPQSLFFYEDSDISFKLHYFLKAQIVPLSSELICDGMGKSQLRDS